MNHMKAENFMRSANAPAISAGVMIAKVIWKHMIDRFGDGRRERAGRVDAHRREQEVREAAEV